MYKINDNIKGVKQGCFILKNELLFWIDDDKQYLHMRDNLKNENRLYKEVFHSLYLWDNYVHKDKNVFFDAVLFCNISIKRISVSLNESLSLIANDDSDLLYKIINEDEERFSYHIYNSQNGIIDLDDKLRGARLMIAGYIVCSTSRIINCYKYKKGLKQIWQLNFCDLLQNDRAILHSEIIEHKGKLYFFLDGSNRNRTFCVDIESGEVLNEYDALQGWLVKDGDDLYVSCFETIVKLNTLTNEITEWEVSNLLLENGLGDYLDYHRYTVHNGLIYFTQSLGVMNPNIGILDFVNRKLLWSYSFNGKHGAIGSIKVHGNRLFVHTQDNTLHIFEKEL